LGIETVASLIEPQPVYLPIVC